MPPSLLILKYCVLTALVTPYTLEFSSLLWLLLLSSLLLPSLNYWHLSLPRIIGLILFSFCTFLLSNGVTWVHADVSLSLSVDQLLLLFSWRPYRHLFWVPPLGCSTGTSNLTHLKQNLVLCLPNLLLYSFFPHTGDLQCARHHPEGLRIQIR